MPYIKKELREKLDLALEMLDMAMRDHKDLQNPGVLNYLFTKLVCSYMDIKSLNYQTINDISGALTECLGEFRRRIVIPYETKKTEENGDVYGARGK